MRLFRIFTSRRKSSFVYIVLLTSVFIFIHYFIPRKVVVQLKDDYDTQSNLVIEELNDDNNIQSYLDELDLKTTDGNLISSSFSFYFIKLRSYILLIEIHHE